MLKRQAQVFQGTRSHPWEVWCPVKFLSSKHTLELSRVKGAAFNQVNGKPLATVPGSRCSFSSKPNFANKLLGKTLFIKSQKMVSMQHGVGTQYIYGINLNLLLMVKLCNTSVNEAL